MPPETVRASVMVTLPSGTSSAVWPSVPVIVNFSSLESQTKASPAVPEWKVTSPPEPSEPTVSPVKAPTEVIADCAA